MCVQGHFWQWRETKRREIEVADVIVRFEDLGALSRWEADEPSLNLDGCETVLRSRISCS